MRIFARRHVAAATLPYECLGLDEELAAIAFGALCN